MITVITGELLEGDVDLLDYYVHLREIPAALRWPIVSIFFAKKMDLNLYFIPPLEAKSKSNAKYLPFLEISSKHISCVFMDSVRWIRHERNTEI